MRELIKKAKTLVIKVGTSTLTHTNGSPNLRLIENLVRVLCDLNNQGKNVILVSSGAIGVGMFKMGLSERPRSLQHKQALASIGQVTLIQVYSRLFAEYSQTISQVLLTKDVVDEDLSRINAVNTFNTLLDYGVIPIVNENDTVATDEIEFGIDGKSSFGDNDSLSAVVASLVGADLLIMLSDQDGLYDKNPQTDNTSKYYNLN